MEIKVDSNYSLDDTKDQIEVALNDYIDNLEEENIIYYKALSAVGDLNCVDDIETFTINNGQENISVGDYYIPVIETITVTDSEVV